MLQIAPQEDWVTFIATWEGGAMLRIAPGEDGGAMLRIAPQEDWGAMLRIAPKEGGAMK